MFFPTKLHCLLEKSSTNEQLSRIVSWLPGGLAFKIHDPEAFTESVLPMYFHGMNSLRSFLRQLNLYGIRKLSKGRLQEELDKHHDDDPFEGEKDDLNRRKGRSRSKTSTPRCSTLSILSSPSWNIVSSPPPKHDTELIGAYYHDLFRAERRDLTLVMSRPPTMLKGTSTPPPFGRQLLCKQAASRNKPSSTSSLKGKRTVPTALVVTPAKVWMCSFNLNKSGGTTSSTTEEDDSSPPPHPRWEMEEENMPLHDALKVTKTSSSSSTYSQQQEDGIVLDSGGADTSTAPDKELDDFGFLFFHTVVVEQQIDHRRRRRRPISITPTPCCHENTTVRHENLSDHHDPAFVPLLVEQEQEQEQGNFNSSLLCPPEEDIRQEIVKTFLVLPRQHSSKNCK